MSGTIVKEAIKRKCHELGVKGSKEFYDELDVLVSRNIAAAASRCAQKKRRF